MRMNKKGGLDLSIQAIVIIVLAMTLLGLGLGFIRGLFGNINQLSDSTFQKISEELSTKLATGDESLIFSQSRITIERRGSSLEGFGVRNDGNLPIKYGLVILTVDCPEEAKTSNVCVDTSKWFQYFKGTGQYGLKAAEKQVNKVQIDVPADGKTGLYLLKIVAYTGTWDEAKCGDSLYTTCTKLGQTELFLTVA